MPFGSVDANPGNAGMSAAITDSNPQYLITGNLQWEDNADPALSGDSDTYSKSGGDGLTDHILFTDNFTVPDGDTFDQIDITVIDAVGNKTTVSITEADGTAQVDDGDDDVDLTELPLKVYALVKTDNAPAGLAVEFWISKP